MRKDKAERGRVRAFLVAMLCCAASGCWWLTRGTYAEEPPSTASREINEALGWMKSAPQNVTNFDYVMTARVRLLVFWAGKDDVGGGYIRRGFVAGDQRQELIQVLFGSDPAKAPRAINRWGAGTEIAWHTNAGGGKAARMT
jgi:hypothetical protein